MDRIEEFASPIRSVLEIYPAYTAISVLLGFYVYRWNANRVRRMIRATTFAVLRLTSRPKFTRMDLKSLCSVLSVQFV